MCDQAKSSRLFKTGSTMDFEECLSFFTGSSNRVSIVKHLRLGSEGAVALFHFQVAIALHFAPVDKPRIRTQGCGSRSQADTAPYAYAYLSNRSLNVRYQSEIAESYEFGRHQRLVRQRHHIKSSSEPETDDCQSEPSYGVSTCSKVKS